MRYFQISTGLPGCLWDYSFAVECETIVDLADALQEHFNSLLDEDAPDSDLLNNEEAERWAMQAWDFEGAFPLSACVKDDPYLVAVNACTAEEAKEINDETS